MGTEQVSQNFGVTATIAAGAAFDTLTSTQTNTPHEEA